MALQPAATRDDAGAATGPDRAVQHAVVLVRLGNWVGALPIDRVDRILPAVEIHAASRFARDLLGHVNVHGTIVAVANARKILGLPRRAISLSDHLVLVTTGDGPVVVPVDEAIGVGAVSDDASGAPGPFRPVKSGQLSEPLVTLIDPDAAFGIIARRSRDAHAVR